MMTRQKRPDRTLGRPHDDFWAWCGDDELRLQACDACNAIVWPPVHACEVCGSSKLHWRLMSGVGSIAAWCTFERDYYYGLLGVPWDTILVELSEGPLFLGNPQGFDWRETTIGMRVKVAFVDCEDSAGPFRLPVFKRDRDTS